MVAGRLTEKHTEIRPGRFLAVHHFPAGSSTASDFGRDGVGMSGVTESRSSAGTSPRQSAGTIFFFHGIGGCARVWRHQVAFFAAKGYDVIVPDCLGHGESSASDNVSHYALSELMKDALAVFDQFASTRRNVIVGHSYGTMMSVVVAHDRQDRVSRLVLLAGGGTDAMGTECDQFSFPVCCLVGLSPFYTSGFLKRAFSPKSKSSVTPADKKNSWSASSFVLRATWKGQIWVDLDEKYYETIHVPCLLIQGEEDMFIDMEEEYEMLRALPRAWLRRLQGVGHMVMLERPELLNEMIDDFLDNTQVEREGIMKSQCLKRNLQLPEDIDYKTFKERTPNSNFSNAEIDIEEVISRLKARRRSSRCFGFRRSRKVSPWKSK